MQTAEPNPPRNFEFNDVAGARLTPLPFALPDVTQAEIDAVTDVLRSGWLTTGPRAVEFEQAFADRIGVRHAVALSSGTAALHLALEAVGVGPGDEVIVPTYTFTASAEVVSYLHAKPVLVDIEADTLAVDPAAVEAALTPRTRALIGVDIGGQPCDWHLLRPLAERHSFTLVADAAHSLPSMLCGQPVGCLADLTAFSFYATKTLTTGEGGMLVTDNTEWSERVRLMSLHGMKKDAWKRYMALGSWYYEVETLGYKYNMSDIAAALGLVQLCRIEEMQARRAAIAAAYTDAFSDFPELELPSVRPDRTTSWHLFILRLNLERLRCDRAQFIQELAVRKIAASVHFIPLHRHPYYRATYGYGPEDFPVAERAYGRVLSLPIYSRMSNQDVADVIEAVARIVDRYRR